MSVFYSVPGVPCAKMERFAGVDTQTCTSSQRGWRRVWDEVTFCLCRTHINLKPKPCRYVRVGPILRKANHCLYKN